MLAHSVVAAGLLTSCMLVRIQPSEPFKEKTVLNSNSTHACFNCRKAWKSGGTCGCNNPDIVYMGKKWRAPRSSQTHIWNKMKRDKEAGVKMWHLWDKQSIDRRQQSKRRYIPMTPEEKQKTKERIAKAMESIAYQYEQYRKELQAKLEEDAAKHAQLRKEINRRRKQRQEN